MRGLSGNRGRMSQREQHVLIDHTHRYARNLVFAAIGSCADCHDSSIYRALGAGTTAAEQWDDAIKRFCLSSTATVISTTLSVALSRDEFTLSSWVWSVSGAAANTIAPYFGNSASDGFGMLYTYEGTTRKGMFGGVNFLTLTSGGTMEYGTWFHIAMTRVLGYTVVYLNGESVYYSNALTPNAPTNTLILNDPGASGLLFKTADTMAWSRCLEGEDIKRIANPYNYDYDELVIARRRWWPVLSLTSGNRRRRVMVAC